MSKVISALICSVLLATPALADFYVVQDASTKRCTIVEEKPTSTTTVVVGGGSVYTSRTEAEGAMKSIEVCSSGTTTGSTTTTTTTTKQ
jgi:hypothetical protein